MIAQPVFCAVRQSRQRSASALGKEPLPMARPADWTSHVRGVVHAADWYLRERPQKAAKLRELGVGRED